MKERIARVALDEIAVASVPDAERTRFVPWVEADELADADLPVAVELFPARGRSRDRKGS